MVNLGFQDVSLCILLVAMRKAYSGYKGMNGINSLRGDKSTDMRAHWRAGPSRQDRSERVVGQEATEAARGEHPGDDGAASRHDSRSCVSSTLNDRRARVLMCLTARSCGAEQCDVCEEIRKSFVRLRD